LERCLKKEHPLDNKPRLLRLNSPSPPLLTIWPAIEVAIEKIVYPEPVYDYPTIFRSIQQTSFSKERRSEKERRVPRKKHA
jgi:hypothetical protein